MLRKGQTFTIAGKPFKVAYVTPCRAHCRSLSKRLVTVTDKKGKVRTFQAVTDETLDISPNTDLDVLAEFERGLRKPVFQS